MKKMIALFLISLSSTSFALQADPVGKKSNYFYFELVPNQKLTLILTADKICKNNSDKITVEEFESKTQSPTIDKNQPSEIRIKNIYAESFSVCTNVPSGKLEKKISVGPYKEIMTHIRLTTTDNIEVKSSI